MKHVNKQDVLMIIHHEFMYDKTVFNGQMIRIASYQINLEA